MASLIKVTIRLDTDDVEMLKQAYPKFGYNKIIRMLVARHVKAIREKSDRSLSVELPEVLLNDSGK